MSVTVFDDRPCALGEGPLWHPMRKQLFWFDILGKRMLSRDATGPQVWQFDAHVSAAGWLDEETLLIASETALIRFDLATGTSEVVAPLEAGNPVTRSNDGRADPQGGFWIGTMGKRAEPGAGAIYRYFRGELRQLFPGITISNAICFAPSGQTAYFTDTPRRLIQSVALDQQGWPQGDPQVFIDLNAEGLAPDGAVVDAQGCLWNAQWGASRVARYGPDGRFLSALEVPAVQTTCPAFGGPGLRTLFVTSATDGLAKPAPGDGLTHQAVLDVAGQAEHQVIL